MKVEKRQLDVVVISDTHLGTIGCHSEELYDYLCSISPQILVLNGDIIDIWNFRKNFFPKEHMQVLQKIAEMATIGVQVYYLTGNHDELLRKFTDFSAGGLHLKNKLVLNLDGKKAWIFHGDVFDMSIQKAKWLAKLGGWGYDALIYVNRFINVVLEKSGRPPYSLSKKIKNSVKKALKYISDFENTASELAIDQGYHFVICGHIHHPQIREVNTKDGSTLYLNSGDWVENLTALEYNEKQWKIYRYEEDTLKQENKSVSMFSELSSAALLQKILSKESQLVEI